MSEPDYPMPPETLRERLGSDGSLYKIAFEAGRHSRDNEVGALLAERDRLNEQLNEAHSYWRRETDMELKARDQTSDEPKCICGPDSTGEAPDVRPDCPAHDSVPSPISEEPF